MSQLSMTSCLNNFPVFAGDAFAAGLVEGVGFDAGSDVEVTGFSGIEVDAEAGVVAGAEMKRS